MNRYNKKSPTADLLPFNDEQFIWRFSPNQTAPELLEAIFVGREPLLQNILEKIADTATSKATHHVLLHGPRGIGKSHFVSLLHHRLVNDAITSDSVHIAWLNEEETTTSMVQLLVRIYRSLCKWYPQDYSAEWLNELLDQPTSEIGDILTRRLVARFEKRRLVILVENLNLLFENLGTDGQHQLRTLLHEHPFACLIATSQHLFKAVTDRTEPFFGFFQQIPLKPLTLADAQSLMVKIAETKGQMELVQFLNTPDGLGRVRAIHDLAGGNHRVYIVLSGFATRESIDELVTPFQKMADDLTPYYQERLRGISPLQRQIVELLCRQHGTVNPKEIARNLLVDQRSIGKQVRILEEMGYLMSTKRGRETYYELSEPLMRLAYEVKEQGLLHMLIKFLRVWYRPDEMQELRTDYGFDEIIKERVRAMDSYNKAVELDPNHAFLQFHQSEKLFAMHRWEDGFEAIRCALLKLPLCVLGDASALFSLIFQLSEDEPRLQTRINTLVDLYEQAAKKHGYRPAVNPLSHLANGLVKSLAKIDAKRFTPTVLASYVAAVEQRAISLPEFQISIRLFRYGIRYLTSGKESEFVELIQPERRILRQAFGLSEEQI
ncbi:AAA family ATPase [Pirellulaceae bacterium SH449]